MCSPSAPAPQAPPPAPDYRAAAAEQGAANLAAAKLQGRINNPNVISPYGTQTVKWGDPTYFDEARYNQVLDQYKTQGYWTDSAGTQLDYEPAKSQFMGLDPNTPTITQKFSPEQQAIYDKQVAAKKNIGDLAVQGSDALKGVVGKQFDLSGMPAAPGSAEATRDKVIAAMMGRVDEDYGRSTDQANSDLIAAGIRPGSKAYDDKMQLLQRGRNDALNQAIISSGAEAQRDFGMDSDRRRQAIAELLSQRQTPLNEVSALMSGAQVTNPFSMPGYAQNTQVQPAPIFNAAQAQGQYGLNAYNAQNQANAAYDGGGSNGLMNGLFSLGSAAILASDRRLKSNIIRVGTHPLGIGVYDYDIFGRRERGVMAQELQPVMPQAVVTHPQGYLMVNYAMIGGRP